MTYPKSKILKKLTTPRLVIRHHQASDFEQYVEAENYSSKDLIQWFGWVNKERGYNSREEIQEYFSYLDSINTADKPRQLHFFIFNRESNSYMGTLIFFRIDWDIPYFYFSYWLDSRHHGNGYMSEAVNAVSRLCFTVYGAKRVQISASITNSKSLSIPKRLNFTLEGELKNYAMNLQENVATNSLMYACCSEGVLPSLKCDWELCK